MGVSVCRRNDVNIGTRLVSGEDCKTVSEDGDGRILPSYVTLTRQFVSRISSSGATWYPVLIPLRRHLLWDHTVNGVTCHSSQVNAPRLTPVRQARVSLPFLPSRDGRLSWTRWLVTNRDGLPFSRQSPPIQVVTAPDVEQVR